MATRPTAPAGSPCWIDLSSTDIDRSRDFYTRLFGWTAEDPDAEFGGYFNFTKNGTRIAGAMAHQPGMPGVPDTWSVFLASDDARKTVDTAAANGAQVAVPPMAVGDLGTMAGLVDPGGAFVGIWQPGSHTGFGLWMEHGTPGWFELNTREYDASLAFYQSVFGWETQVISDTPDFRYVTHVVGDEQDAAIMDATNMLADGVGSHWAVYFATDDTDATAAQLVELGGTIITPPEDTPYGRLAAAVDPVGTSFKLVGPNDQMPAVASLTAT